MKPSITRFAVTLGVFVVVTLFTGNAPAECGAAAKIKANALIMPPLAGQRSDTFLPVAALFDRSVDGAAPIVGLWDVHYTSNLGAPPFETYQQFHSDGLEIETPDFAPGVCMGVWKLTAQAGTVKIFHVGFTQGAIPGTYRFELREIDTVSADRKTFAGWYDQKFFDKNGNLVSEDKGTHQGTRLSVDQF